ncbi:hypothetical protein [Geosporobacter ferrireducens]|uniref:Uncharacterized protein n=1 Tax=Geosporobacter ferrireducens TaxID=1424294 RepID=A0A1D8GMU1_9FIRM|nr:hypothetical protein [Geosporobacter ferrireducens]AOT72220.1 hypothetical protein Gferi_23355 [Geosporobacter ferrireducens]MTI56114.1 hypothetical protein [Geosporobacter ferrireducens]
MARKELIVKSYIVRDGERTLISSLPEEEQKKIASALKDKFMLSLGYVPEDTEKEQEKPEMLKTSTTY